MRHTLVFLLLVASGCAYTQSRDAAPVAEIFRYTTIGRSLPADSIVLGQRWPSAAKYGATDADTMYALPYGTFGGADAIAVSRDSRGVVTEITFAYHPRRNAGALLADYRSSLGAPVAVRVDTVGTAIHTTTVWRDAVTEFSFVVMSPPGADGVGAMAILADRRRASR